MALNFKVKVDDSALPTMGHNLKRAIRAAAVGALAQVANDAVAEGRQQIASSGRFSGPRRTLRAQDTWLTGLKARMRDTEGLQPKAIVFHTVGLAGIFEHGATIQGRPMLWIPTDPRARPPGRSGKKLTAATVRGRPMLFDANDRDRHRKPLYIGVPSIRIPKKWRIIEIVKQHASQLAAEFYKRFQG